ncbi:MAG: 4-hydroxy-tetrahydrodipicolinate reductase [Ilumatobacteraceae bacterium]|jgi:4-hydroxy-tetrahydrodipicolinate reductase|nr:4-hydroxy-tetrahydrodipicolinate reductase [Ilumatobacteraceae bacterium]
MSIKVCIAGTTGWTGSVVARHLLASPDFDVVGAIARRSAGNDLGVELGLPPIGVIIRETLDEVLALGADIDVLVDYTDHVSVKPRTLTALSRGIRVVVGTSGLTAADFAEIGRAAAEHGLGVVAAGNFSITAALAKHFSLIAARHVPSWEIIDYAGAAKVDAPSGTTQELAESMGEVAPSQLGISLDEMHGPREVRGATIGGTQVHSVRLPGFVIAFETIFGLPDERLTIRHDAGSGAEPYAVGTLVAVKKVMETTGLIRGLDQLLFAD